MTKSDTLAVATSPTETANGDEYLDAFPQFAPKQLVRTVYHSKLLAESAEEGERMIDEILKVSVRNNKKAKVGGVLLFNSQTMEIVQVLEGPFNKVRDTMRRIMNDSRHTQIDVKVPLGAVQTRTYKRWGMLKGTSSMSWKLVKSMLPDTSRAALGASFDDIFDAKPAGKTCLPV